MATGSLHAIFPFKVFLRTFLIFTLAFFLSFEVAGRLGLAFRVHAAAWYTVIGGGILSGGDINNQYIPPSPTLPYGPVTVQNPGGVIGNPSAGALISSGGQNVKVNNSAITDDAYIKNIGIDLSLNRLDVANMAGASGIVTITNCSGRLNQLNRLNPDAIYGARASCISRLNATGYNLLSPGLAIIIVNDSANSINFTEPVSQTDPAKRVLIVTDSRVSYASSVNGLDLSIISTNTSSYSVQGSAVEGPMIAKYDLVLSYDRVNLPGSVVTFNPIYPVELSKKGLKNLEIKGLLESKSIWRYE